MACRSCAEALERAASVIYELSYMHPDELPPLPPLASWVDLGALLVDAAGRIRQDIGSPPIQHGVTPWNTASP